MNRDATNEQEQLAWERQLIVFGMALASKEIRAQLRQEDFSSTEIGYAFAEMCASRRSRPHGIKYLMSGLGIPDWHPKDGNPGKVLIEHIRLDARFHEVVGGVIDAFARLQSVQSATASEKIEALKHAEEVTTTAYRIQQAAKQAATSRLTEASEGDA